MGPIAFVKYVKSGTSAFFRTSQEQLYRQEIAEQKHTLDSE